MIHAPVPVRWLGYPLMLLAVFVLVGGHWAVLQTVAWAGMLRSYSQSEGLLSGLKKTFNGKNPCGLCMKVQDGKQQEEGKLPLLKIEKKSEAWLEPVRLQFSIVAEAAPAWPGWVAAELPTRRDAPQSPPPQAQS